MQVFRASGNKHLAAKFGLLFIRKAIMPYLIEILLPVSADKYGHALETIRSDLTERFGGVTVYEKAPADGLWKHGRKVEHDRTLLVEVMVEELNRSWWEQYRKSLEQLLSQEKIVMRAIAFERL